MTFQRTKQSDFLCVSPNNAKTAPFGMVFQNGARYFARIGVKIVKSTRNCDIS